VSTLADRLEDMASSCIDEWCGSVDCPRGCASLAKLILEVRDMQTSLDDTMCELATEKREVARLLREVERLGTYTAKDAVYRAAREAWARADLSTEALGIVVSELTRGLSAPLEPQAERDQSEKPEPK
jgi:hypothetical protein